MTSASDDTLDPAGRIALIGAGTFGRFCLDAYRRSSDFKVVAVADPVPAALELVDEPAALLVGDWREVLRLEEVEAIHVATPPFLRGEIVDAALAAGKSVFCEKPLALSLAEADRMIADAERYRVGLGINHVMRHHPAYAILEHLSASGLFGRLRTISFHNFAQVVPPDHWFWDLSRSGGILVEHGVHFFDAYARVAGAAQSVSGTIPRREAIDVAVHYEGGTFGRFYHEFAFPRVVEQTVGVCAFERGTVTITGWIPTAVSGSATISPEALREALTAFEEAQIVSDGAVASFTALFPDRQRWYQRTISAGMRDLIEHHRDPSHRMVVSAADARASLALALAAQNSAEQHRSD